MPDISELVRHLARQLVDQPDAVEVETKDGSPILYEIRVAPDDQGRIIGRDGRTIQAIRTLVAAAAKKSGESCNVELADE